MSRGNSETPMGTPNSRMQAQMAAKTHALPESWPESARLKVEPLLPHVNGNVTPYGRSLREERYRPRI